MSRENHKTRWRLEVTSQHAGGRQILTSRPRETVVQQRRDGREGSNARLPWLVTALHTSSGGPGDACARTFLWKRELRFGRWCCKSGDKSEAKYLYPFHQRPNLRRVPCRTRNEGSIPRAVKFCDLITADHKILVSSLNGYNLIRVKPKLHRRRRKVDESF